MLHKGVLRRFGAFIWTALVAFTALSATHQVPDGGSITVDGTSVRSKGDTITLAGSGTINLSFPAEGDGQSYLFTTVVDAANVADGSVVTVNLAAVSDKPVRMSGSFLIKKGAKAILIGGGAGPEVRFGSSNPIGWDEVMGGSGYSYFRCHDIQLQQGATVKFVNYLRHYSPVPKGDGIAIDPNARLGLFAVNALENYLDEDGNVDIVDFSAVVHAVNALPQGKKVTVGAGKTLELKLFANEKNEYAGSRPGTVTNDIVLAGGQLIMRSMQALTLQGSVTGEGTVRAFEFGDPPGNTANGNVIDGQIGFSGSIVLDQGSIRFTDTDFSVDGLAGSYPACKLILAPGASVSCEQVGGMFSVETSSGGASSLNVGSVLADTDFQGAGSVQVAVEGACIEYEKDDSRHFARPADGSMFECAVPGVAEYALFGKVEIGRVSTGCRIRVDASAEATVYGYGTEFSLKNEGGSVRLADESLTIAQADPSLWLDANSMTRWCISTNASGVGQYRMVGGVSYPVMMKWQDVRPDRNDCYAYESRNYQSGSYADLNRVYPILVTNGYDGVKSYVSMKNDSQCVRFRLVSPAGAYVDAKFAVLVYGSEHGGSSALLAQPNGRFSRTTSDESAAATRDDPIMLDDDVPVWLNGRKVAKNSEQTLAEGNGWDIVSIDLTADGASEKINGLGFKSDPVKAGGGALYAEVLLFDRVLSDYDRTQIERELAAKWNLSGKYDSAASKSRVTLSGAGDITVSGDYVATGLVKGTLVLDGGTLETEGQAVSSESDVRSIPGRVGWFNPNDTSLIQFYSATRKEEKPLEMVRLYDHIEGTEGSVYLRDSGGAIDNRAPWLNDAVRVPGIEKAWMDFEDSCADDTFGNYFKFNSSLPVRMAFILSDSCRGGGSPLLDDTRGNKIKGRNTKNPASPIWQSGTDPIVTDGQTYLDGVVVDGRTVGFSGRPELFAFSTTDTIELTHLGDLDNSSNHRGWGEILGESIFFNRVLDEDERHAVETYLMSEWLGVLPQGFVSLAPASVSGTGLLKTSRAVLPAHATFSGTFELADETLQYAVSEDRLVLGVMDYPSATLAFPDHVAVRIALPQKKLRAGDYVLINCAGFSGTTEWTLDLTGPGAEALKEHALLTVREGKLLLTVKPLGLALIFR